MKQKGLLQIRGVYVPPQEILEKYADVLVNYALGGGKGIKRGDVVHLVSWESAKPMFVELRKAILRAGGHIIDRYLLDGDDRYGVSRNFYEIANIKQLNFFPKKFIKGLVDEIDHYLVMLSDADPRALSGIDPKKIMTKDSSMDLWWDWRHKKENEGKFTWTLALYGTPAMAEEANLTIEECWGQIINACFLNEKNPIRKWVVVNKKLEKYRKKLNALKIERLHVEGPDIDLWLRIGERRSWIGGSGRNIPSFEIFTSPDWRGTEGWIRFNQPLYRYGNLITDVELKFKNGRVVKSSAAQNENLLKEMIAQKNADKVGEFSLTDRRFSKITKFMAHTLYDENIGGPHGNTHIALGNAYQDCFDGDPNKLTKKDWQKLGYNNSVVHTDIISTTRRKITAYSFDGSIKVIYENGQFTL